MNTKKAIECVKDKYESYDAEWCAGTKEVDKCYKEQDEVIEVLMRGEKFEEIVKKIKYELNTSKAILINGEDIRSRIKMLELKYFPNERGDNNER